MEYIQKLKDAKIYVKPVNYALGFASIGAGVLLLLDIIAHGGSTLYSYFAPFYFAAFGLIMLASDLGIKVIIENCNFLDIYIGRGMFSIFVGSQIANAANKEMNKNIGDLFNVSGAIIGYVLMGLGVYLIILHCLEKETSMSGNSGDVAKDLKMKAAKAVIANQLGI